MYYCLNVAVAVERVKQQAPQTHVEVYRPFRGNIVSQDQ